jgi:hypothetical protein
MREGGLDIAHRIGRVISEIGQLEVGWVSCERAEVLALESELLDAYAKDHIELPPLNRQESGIRVRQLLRLISSLPSDQRREALVKLMPELHARER